MKQLSLLLLLVTSVVFSQQYPTGMVWNEASYRSIPYKVQFTADTYEYLPASYSLEEYAPIPGNQGQYGTCVAYASAYGLRTIMLAKDLGITNKQVITENALSPSYIYTLIKYEDDINCDKGADPRLGLEALKIAGAPLLKTLPYACNPDISTEAQLEAIDYKIRDYQTLFFGDTDIPNFKVNSTKKALSEGYPVLLGTKLPPSFFEAKLVWHSLASEKDEIAVKHGYHAMVVIGYDDDFEGGAFRVLNSWGTDWGDNGFIWIPYTEYEEWSLGAMQPYSYYKKEEMPEQDEDVIPEPDIDPIAKYSPKGSLHFETNIGKEMPVSRTSTRNLTVEDDVEGEDLVAYRMKDSYPSGTRFRFYLKNENEAYIYAFATDLTQVINKILPFDDGMSPLISANSEFAFPSEKKVIRMDNNPGSDYLLILFSQQKLDEKELLRIMQNTNGGLTSKIKAALGDKLIDKGMIQYQSDSPGFNVKDGAKGYVVPVMVELTHL
ncbi:MAG: DUF4384 domain-containing protein [Flavobacteriaceae bacterium]